MIGIIGATGFTGELVARELQKQSANFFIAGRNESLLKSLSKELGDVQWRIVDVQDKSTFDSGLADCRVIINCAGPFTELGEVVVQEAISRRVNYLDITGEQSFIMRVYEKYDTAARDAGVVIVPACAFEYAIGDAAAARLCEQMPKCDRIEALYETRGIFTSPGTRKSIISALAAPGFQLRNGALVETAPAASVKIRELDGQRKCFITFPGGEVLMLPKHSQVRTVETLMSANEIPKLALSALGWLGQRIARPSAGFLKKLCGQDRPSESQRQSTRFSIWITASSEDARRVIKVSGTDPYWLTAVIVSAAAVHLHLVPSANKSGALTPSMVLSYSVIRDLLIQCGADWQEYN